MSNKLKALVDPIAGEYGWYVAGGGAAWWHIVNHMMFWHGAHDWTYFNSIQEQIFPHDIEGSALVEVNEKFMGKYGVMDVQLAKLDKARFDELVEQLCVRVDGINVLKPEAIIRRYQTTGDASKKAKRDLRVALLKLVCSGQPITEKGVEDNKPKGLGFLAALGGVKLKHVDTTSKDGTTQ